MAKKVSILVGSLRKGSFARKVAQNVIPMFPEGYEAQIVEIGGLPLYNFDYDDPAETNFPTPESYTAFRETIKASDGVLFVTSENNRTVPACLKNAVDIGSKPNADVAWKKHARRHHQPFRRQNGRLQFAKKPAPCLVLLQYAADRQPEVFLGNSPTLFDDNGKLIESARSFVQGYIDQLVALIEKNPK